MQHDTSKDDINILTESMKPKQQVKKEKISTNS